MKKLSTYCSFVVSFFLLFLMVSCSRDCYESTRVELGVEFGEKDLSSSITLDRVAIQGVENDSILYNRTSTSIVYLPLKINEDSTAYSFSYVQDAEGDDPADTLYYLLEVAHQSSTHLISPECGCVMFQHLSSFQIIPVTDEPELEIEIVDAELQNSKQVHVKIYF